MRSACYIPEKEWGGPMEGKGGFGSKTPDCLAEFFQPRVPPIRSSGLKDFEHCPRKFLYRYRLGIAPKTHGSALFRGKVFHLVMEALFTGQPEHEAVDAAKPYFHRLCNEVMASVDPAGYTPDGKSAPALIESMDQDYNKARAMAATFMRFNPFDWDKWEILYDLDNLPCVELLMEAKVAGIKVPIISPCDLALHRLGTNEVWIVDHKTTSSDTLARARSVKISAQLQLYRLVLQCHIQEWANGNGIECAKYADFKVVGSIHNIVKTPTIKYCPKTKDKAGFSAYIERLEQWYKDLHEKDPAHSPMLQPQTRFSDPVLSEELYLRLQKFANASRMHPNIHKFFRAGDYACHEFNSVCPYSDLCASEPQMWPDMVRNRFEIKFREDSEDD